MMKKGLKILLSAVCFILSLFISSTVSSQTTEESTEYKEYKILKGDTLWDISFKELNEKDPFLWPKIWKENPGIKNPDRIYPGQILKIPLYLLKQDETTGTTSAKETAPETETKAEETVKTEKPQITAKTIEPIQKKYIADTNLILSSGYITDYITKDIKSVGKITGSPTGRLVFGDNDYIYIKTDSPANIGDKFYIIRSTGYIKHPKTNEKLGNLITVLGIAEIIGKDNGATKAKVLKAFNEIVTGNLLDKYYEVEPVMEEANPRKPDIKASIIAIQFQKNIGGQSDILFIDKGKNHGLETGDMLKVIAYDKDTKSRYTGTIQLINVKNSTSTALIRTSEIDIKTGDDVLGLNNN
ncbi:MAG: LysM peptidoglycan-binding domain-containing protein [Nitrospiraceae bacterium]|nr:LysM peptidoglycan-binding domain-containing protein [Nitrospiraceae bacterium]